MEIAAFDHLRGDVRKAFEFQKWKKKQVCSNVQNVKGLHEVSLDHEQNEDANLLELLRSVQGRHSDTHTRHAPWAGSCPTQTQ